MMDSTLDLPKPTTDADEFEARMEDVIDRYTLPGHRHTELLLAVTRYQAQCFALLLQGGCDR